MTRRSEPGWWASWSAHVDRPLGDVAEHKLAKQTAPREATLSARAPEDTVMSSFRVFGDFTCSCPSCGSAWSSLSAIDTEDWRGLSELAPQGVRPPNEVESLRYGAADLTESGWGPVIGELGLQAERVAES